MKRLLSLVLLIVGVAVTGVAQQDPCSQGTPYRDCAACGTATILEGKILDVQKNRDDPVTSPKKITVATIRNPKNNKKFSAEKQVWVKAYVVSVVPGGMPENCNCGKSTLRDIHINIVASPSEAKDQSKYVVVEFTPRWEKTFDLIDSDYFAMLEKVKTEIRHKWVRFEGWMLYDRYHENAAQSTRPKQKICTKPNQKKCNWRATPWEVHPVTKYEVVSGP